MFRKKFQKFLSQMSIGRDVWHTFAVLVGVVLFLSVAGACSRPMPQPDKFGLGTKPIGQFFKSHDVIDERFTQDLRDRFESKNKYDDFKYYEEIGMVCEQLAFGHFCYYIGIVELKGDGFFYLNSSQRSGWIKYSIYKISVNCVPDGCDNIVMTTTYWQAR